MTSTFDVINPATEEVVRTVGLTSAEETDAAIARAQAALPAWRAVAPGDRARLLRRFAVAVDEQAPAEYVDRLVELVVRVRDRPGEVRRDGELHGGEAGRQAALACEDGRRLASVGERGPVTAVGKQGHSCFLPRAASRRTP